MDIFFGNVRGYRDPAVWFLNASGVRSRYKSLIWFRFWCMGRGLGSALGVVTWFVSLLGANIARWVHVNVDVVDPDLDESKQD
jgi:hypothetical protein